MSVDTLYHSLGFVFCFVLGNLDQIGRDNYNGFKVQYCEYIYSINVRENH